MDFLKDCALVVIGWLGGALFSTSLSIVGCCIFSGFPLLKLTSQLGGDAAFNVHRIKHNYVFATVFHSVLFTCVCFLVYKFVPYMMKFGFLLNVAFAIISGIKAWGINEANLSDFHRTLRKNVIPGMEEMAEWYIQKVVAQKAVAPKTTGWGMQFLRGLFATILLWFIGRVFPSMANAYIYEVCNLNSAVFLSAIVAIGSIFLAYWTADTLTLHKSINCIRVNLIIILVIEALGVIGSFGYLAGSTEGLQAVFMDGLYIGACGYLIWLASKRIEKSEG